MSRRSSPPAVEAPPLPGRRLALLAGLSTALPGVGLIGTGAEAAGTVAVEGGVPRQLPPAAIADLKIELDDGTADGPIGVAVLGLGSIDVPSGRLAGMDALLLDGVPYQQAIEPGRYPLQLVLARLPGGEERAALLQVRLADRAAVRWSNALIEGEDAEDLGDDEVSGFEVESAVACLIDAQALEAWRSALADGAALMSELERVLRENRRPVWTWARVRAAGGSGILVTAGLGEGFAAAYWGLDAAGQPVSLVLDFDLLDWAALPAAEPITA
jgi:hypothetical protein